MSKQVTFYTNSNFEKVLLVRSSYATEPIDKVIVTCKGLGDNAKEFKQLPKETVYGYNMYELFITAQLLREHNITELDLKRFNEAFSLGYSQAYNEFQNSIQKTIDNMFKDLRG